MPDDKKGTYMGVGPESTMESRTRAPSNPLWFSRAKMRQNSHLPFVSWEHKRPTEEDVAKFDAITYPLREPHGLMGLHGNRDRIREMLRKAASRMIKAGVPNKLKTTDGEFIKRIGIAANDMRFPAHHGLCVPFFSWDTNEEVLLAAASISVADVYKGVYTHLVHPQDPVVRFSQAGVGLVGVDPRHVAWRTFLNSQRREVPSHDLLMDLASFAWFVLQHDVTFEHVVLGGTYAEEAEDGCLVLSATRHRDQWMVGLLRPDDASEPAAVIVMS